MRAEVIREVEQFLYREARLLDERRFYDWLELLTDDVRYWMPVQTNRYPVTSKAISILDEVRYKEAELGQEGELAILDETKDSLHSRSVGPENLCISTHPSAAPTPDIGGELRWPPRAFLRLFDQLYRLLQQG